MDPQEFRKLEDFCIQEWAPWCTAACPVHVDVRAMNGAIAKGDFDAAAKALRRSVPFAGIIGRICDHPCEPVCKRREVGEAISIRELERVVTSRVPAETAGAPPLAKKKERVAIVGAGLSGLTAAFDLTRKGYQVVVFEATDGLGGSIWTVPEDELPRTTIFDDFEILNKLSIDFRLATRVRPGVPASEVESDFHAIYIGTGKAAESPFAPETDVSRSIIIDELTFQTSRPGVFAGGSATQKQGRRSPIRSISDGRRAAISIDRFLQKVSLTASRDREGSYETRLFTSVDGVKPLPRVRMSDPTHGFTSDEARMEAARCLQCECVECVKICEYLAEYKGYPKKYVRQIYNNLSIVMGQRQGNKFINSCSLCGLCKEVCPESLNMGDVCKAARGIMVEQGKMPPSAHEFALQDMMFSNSDKVTLARHQPGTNASAYLFFPGCQLSGSSPEHVMKTYAYLSDRLQGGVGLMLRCCGAPAEWAGREETVSQLVDEFRAQWSQMGSPQLILACSSCYAFFKAHLPEAELMSLWEVIDREGLPSAVAKPQLPLVAIHDPCTSRHETRIQESVRRIVGKLGYETEELPLSRDKTECCGFGGLMFFANRELAEKVIRRRIAETPADLLAYCAVCRDHFSSRGKPTWHLLDLIFGDAVSRNLIGRPIDYSLRREKRVRLKNLCLREVWCEDRVESEAYHIHLSVSEKVRGLMEQRMILDEDLQQVIQWAERTGNKLVNQETGHSLAHYRPGAVTYWVEYSGEEGGFTIHNAYSHRMELLEELKP